MRLDVGGACLLFMVDDGMGGAAAGEIAQRHAVHTVLDSSPAAAPAEDSATRRCSPPPCAPPRRRRPAHPRLRDEASGVSAGMGTTATIAGLLGDTLYLAQVGDSRAYILRGGRALQIRRPVAPPAPRRGRGDE